MISITGNSNKFQNTWANTQATLVCFELIVIICVIGFFFICHFFGLWFFVGTSSCEEINVKWTSNKDKSCCVVGVLKCWLLSYMKK